MKAGRNAKRALAPVGIVFAAVVLTPGSAHAYLDPGTASMLLSAVVSIFVTTGLAIQAYWHKLVALFRRGGRRAGGADEAPPADESRRRA
jgi:hypothetical protein